MITPPSFTSLQDHISRLGDTHFWWPYLHEILKRHDLIDAQCEPIAGFNPTYPTFLYGNIVIKLFGYSKSWQQRYLAELAALKLITTQPNILAPHLLNFGTLYDDSNDSWPYLITSKISGIGSGHVQLSYEQQQELALQLGKQVQYIHALTPHAGINTDADWSELNVAEAAKSSSLAPHLIAQIDKYLTKLEPTKPVFTHGDLCEQHIFVYNDKLSGIIDWGDAMVTDRHYELIQLYRGTFNCDKKLFKIFLEASNWPVGKNFVHQTLGQALRRQAIGLAQHHGMDVFEPIAKQFSLKDIETLEQLARELFEL